MKTAAFLLAAAALPLAAQAQFRVTPDGANAGNGFFRNGTLAASLTGSGNSNSEFRPTTSVSSDQSFASGWWFRPAGATREYVFANGSSGGYTAAGVIVGNDLGNLDSGGYDFTVSGAATFTSAQRWSINAGATGPAVYKTNTITNTGTTDLVIDIFSYDDFDVNGTAGTDTWSFSGDTYTISDAGVTVTYRGIDADAHQATDFATLRGLLSDADIDDMNNNPGDGSGDYTGGFQWHLTIAPGASATVAAVMAIPAPGAFAMLGMGGLLASRRRR